MVLKPCMLQLSLRTWLSYVGHVALFPPLLSDPELLARSLFMYVIPTGVVVRVLFLYGITIVNKANASMVSVVVSRWNGEL